MRNKIYNIVRAIVILSACVGFTYASYSLTKSYLGYKSADAAYEEIDNMFRQAQLEDDDSEEDESEQATLESGEVQTQNGGDSVDDIGYEASVKEWVWDYDAMRKYNSEAVGYIKLNDSRIQYPICQHEDNEYYLTHGSNRAANGNGAIFIDARNQGGLDAKHCIIYGHDMMDGSMFAGLLQYANTKYCQSHRVFDIYVGYRHFRYYVFASFKGNAKDEDIYKMGFEDSEDYDKWVSRCMSKSAFDYGIDKPHYGDKTILLSTCMNDKYSRYIVTLVRGEEVVD